MEALVKNSKVAAIKSSDQNNQELICEQNIDDNLVKNLEIQSSKQLKTMMTKVMW